MVATFVTTGELLDAITSTLGAATGIVRSQSYDELSEDYNDLPLLQVYPETSQTDSQFNTNDRNTFGAAGRVTDLEVWVDLIVKQRADLKEDMQRVVDQIDEVERVLFDQQSSLFGHDAIRGFRWNWTRMRFQRGDPGLVYIGARFILTLTVF